MEIKQIVDYYFNKEFKDLFEGKFWHAGIKDSIFLTAMKMRWNFDSTYHFIYDSMAIAYKKDIERKTRENNVYDEVVISAAFAQIKEVIPILKTDLMSTSKHYFNKAASSTSHFPVLPYSTTLPTSLPSFITMIVGTLVILKASFKLPNVFLALSTP